MEVGSAVVLNVVVLDLFESAMAAHGQHALLSLLTQAHQGRRQTAPAGADRSGERATCAHAP